MANATHRALCWPGARLCFQHRRYPKIGSCRREVLGREAIVCRRLFLRAVLKQDVYHHPATEKSSGMERLHARGGLGRQILPTLKWQPQGVLLTTKRGEMEQLHFELTLERRLSVNPSSFLADTSELSTASHRPTVSSKTCMEAVIFSPLSSCRQSLRFRIVNHPSQTAPPAHATAATSSLDEGFVLDVARDRPRLLQQAHVTEALQNLESQLMEN